MSVIELGSEVECELTGFKGIATARTTYITGCDHICLQPRVDKDGKIPEAKWFDEPILKTLKQPRIALERKKQEKTDTGGAMLIPPAK